MHPQAITLRKLPIAERLQVVEDLWEDMEASGEPFPFRAWHREEADRGSAEMEANPSLVMTRDEVWRAVEQSRG